MKKFSRDQIIKETTAIHKGELHPKDSEVFKVWCEKVADRAGENQDFAYDGFKGFSERSPGEILVDLNLHDCLIVPLDDAETQAFLECD